VVGRLEPIEASGVPTVSLSMIPDLTRAVGVPRLAGIGYPLGHPPPPIVELLRRKPWLLAAL